MDKNFPKASACAALERIQKLASMSDAEFADAVLSDLSESELAEFLEECPDFPIDSLPQRAKRMSPSQPHIAD